jgi:hypothetical protein
MTSFPAIEPRPRPKLTHNTPTILIYRLSLPSILYALYRVLNKVLTMEYTQSTSSRVLNNGQFAKVSMPEKDRLQQGPELWVGTVFAEHISGVDGPFDLKALQYPCCNLFTNTMKQFDIT